MPLLIQSNNYFIINIFVLKCIENIYLFIILCGIEPKNTCVFVRASVPSRLRVKVMDWVMVMVRVRVSHIYPNLNHNPDHIYVKTLNKKTNLQRYKVKITWNNVGAAWSYGYGRLSGVARLSLGGWYCMDIIG